MAPVLVAATGCQAGAYFNNETIPPGVHRPRLPWAYTYAQFEALLLAYPTVHPEDFITFGVIQAQPQRGSQGEWGKVAGIVAHMAGSRQLLADAFYAVMRRIQRLARDDPMRAVEEEALVTLVPSPLQRSFGRRGLRHAGGPGRTPSPRRPSTRYSPPPSPPSDVSSTGTFQGSGQTPLQGFTWAQWGPRWPLSSTPRFCGPDD